MSNKVVPQVYRTIMNDVVENVRTDFDEVGVEEAVLNELLRIWELKVAQSRVADFSKDDKMGEVAKRFPPLPNGAQIIPQAGSSNGKLKDESKIDLAGDGAKPKPSADDDAINSDLDDSDDELDNEEEEAAAEGGDLVIALYEKVQRVKNKWKVTFKDGLVSVNGKEYLFTKCNGEFEW
ncbi:transcription factor IIA subunit alpha [Microbotryomycetes sp. JL221]|nr:transcription factor IIA subunit alpha [Microbotryomycetes sp. JL221]